MNVERCGICKGKGKLTVNLYEGDYFGIYIPSEEQCVRCRGEGYILNEEET